MITGLVEDTARWFLLQVTLLAGPGRMLMGTAHGGADAQEIAVAFDENQEPEPDEPLAWQAVWKRLRKPKPKPKPKAEKEELRKQRRRFQDAGRRRLAAAPAPLPAEPDWQCGRAP